MLAFWDQINEFVKLNQGLIQFFVATFTAIVAIATWMAARAAGRSASATRLASQGDLYSGLIDEYTKDETVEDIRRVIRWRRAHEPEFANAWKAALKDHGNRDHNEALGVERSRRALHAFFSKVVELRNAGFLDRKLFNRLILRRMAEVFVKGVAPLSAVLNPQRDDLWQADDYAKRFKIDPKEPFGWEDDPTTDPNVPHA